MIKTTSLETSKFLKENGFKQFGIALCWAEVNQDGMTEWAYEIVKNDFQADNEFIAAPTTDELLEELPREDVGILWFDDKCKVEYLGELVSVKEFINHSLPEALAQMWLYLKREGLLNEKTTTKGTRNGK